MSPTVIGLLWDHCFEVDVSKLLTLYRNRHINMVMNVT